MKEELKKLMNIFRKGLSAMKDDYSVEKIAALRKDFEEKYKTAKAFIDKYNAQLGFKIPEEMNDAVMQTLTTADTVLSKLPEEITAYTAARQALDRATILKILNDNKLQDQEERVINALSIKDQPFKTFISNALKTRKEDDLLPDVKTSILNWVNGILEKL